MDTQTQHRLISQIAQDQAFREALLKDPESTLAQNGYPVNEEVVKAIKQLSPETVDKIAKDLQDGFYQNCQ
jgi:hypothetical protein